MLSRFEFFLLNYEHKLEIQPKYVDWAQMCYIQLSRENFSKHSGAMIRWTKQFSHEIESIVWSDVLSHEN